MRDGYYLATYLNPAGLHRLAHVRLRHDNNVSLWHKSGSTVRLVRHWELERISGQKMHRTPFLDRDDELAFLAGLLAEEGVDLADVVEVWGTPDIDTGEDYHLVREHPGLAFHAIAHVYSAALMDSDVFFGGTVVGLGVDRGPDRVLDGRFKEHWYAGCVVRAGQVELFPVESPGPLYCAARDSFGMREGSLMALATASAATGECDREAVLAGARFDRADAVELSRAAFADIHRQVAATLRPDPAFTEADSLTSAVMKHVQAISVAIMERNLDRILAEHGVDPADAHLALAGGYALNCPTNSHLVSTYGFRGLLAPPCVGDDGQSTGIALAAFHKRIGGRFDFHYPGPYLGREVTGVDEALAEFAEHVVSAGPADTETAVDDLLAGPVAWVAGASEVGPRALGHRSLLADSRSRAAKDELNRVKRREWWRPVAPLVLEEHLDRWFVDARPSPYMLETFAVRPERRAEVPAIVHLDDSARVQSVSAGQEPALHRLVTAFHRRTGVPMVGNTSLNDKGEPIIDTPAEALAFCLRRGVRVAYLDGTRVELRGTDRFAEDGPRPRTHEPFSRVPPERAAALLRAGNPHGLDDVRLYLYLDDVELSAAVDIRTEDGARAARAAVDRRLAADPGLAERTRRAIEKNKVHFAAYGWQPLIPDPPARSGDA
jgi:predicted NodU family carbamoyl transferase